MTQRTTTHRLAGTAIAAVLALSTTPVWAQEAVPAAEAPAAVTAPVPTIVLPPIAVSPAPVVEAAPVEAAPAPRAAAPRAVTAPRVTTAPRAAVQPVNRAATAAAAAPQATTVVSEPVPLESVVETDPLPSDIAAPPVATAEPASSNDSNDLLLAGLAGALGLGAIGLFAATRRRKVVASDEPLVAYEPVSEPVAEEPQRHATLTAPAFTPLKSWSEPRVPQTQPVDSRALNLNRAALLDRMVAAAPEANNPFTAAKARRRRARIMLQSMDNQRWDNAELAPGFDWREMAQAVEQRETITA